MGDGPTLSAAILARRQDQLPKRRRITRSKTGCCARICTRVKAVLNLLGHAAILQIRTLKVYFPFLLLRGIGTKKPRPPKDTLSVAAGPDQCVAVVALSLDEPFARFASAP